MALVRPALFVLVLAATALDLRTARGTNLGLVLLLTGLWLLFFLTRENKRKP